MLSSFTKQNTLLVSSNLQTKEKSGGRFENLSYLKLATEDMSDMLRVFLEEDLSEFFYYKDGEDWFYQLK